MAHSHIVFKNPTYGSVKRAPVGFSWTTAIFGIWPALFRGDFKWFGIQIGIGMLVGVLTFGSGTIVSFIVFGFIYNKLYIKELVKSGYYGYYVEKLESDRTLEQLSAEIETVLPPLPSQKSDYKVGADHTAIQSVS